MLDLEDWHCFVTTWVRVGRLVLALAVEETGGVIYACEGVGVLFAEDLLP